MDCNGKVYLVGAGPGHPGLLTLRGKQVLDSADIILYDRLVGEELIALLPEGTETVDVGKSAGHHLIPQDEINRLILEHASAGKRVVRLKGGDPYLFGRGAEELDAVVDAGIPFEVVPGVTSAIAVPAFGGIPVSHRDYTSSVHIITGHPRHGGRLSIPYEQLAKLGGTLVFLMGVGALAELAEGLTSAGMPKSTPAALVENGTRPNQRRLTASLATIADLARGEDFRPPSVFIVGDVCGLSSRLDWHAKLPLAGKRVLVTRPKASADELAGKLRELGCHVVEYPCIRTQPLSVANDIFANMHRYNWLAFTSPAGVDTWAARLTELRYDLRRLAGVKLAAVGAKTASMLERMGLYADYVPETFNGAALAEGLIAHTKPGESVLLFRARGGSPELAEKLESAGLHATDIAAYETLYDHPDSQKVRRMLEDGSIDAVTFTSASTVEGFIRSLPGLDYSGVTGICIGTETTAAAARYGFRTVTSRKATVDSMVDCLI